MDPLTCCLLGICCPPFSAQQERTFMDALQKAGVDAHKAQAIAAALKNDLGEFSEKVRKAVKGE